MKTNFNFELGEPLSDLAPGCTGTVLAVEDSGAVGRRLLDLGLLPGTPIRVVRHAPLGDPSVFELRGYQLCLRRSESARVRVRPDAAPNQG
jgi:Fe2+ transport system protein FeoA